MRQTVEAIYANGVFVPLEPLALVERARVRLIVEPAVPSHQPSRTNPIEFRRQRRIKLAPTVARKIASSPEFLPEES